MARQLHHGLREWDRFGQRRLEHLPVDAASLRFGCPIRLLHVSGDDWQVARRDRSHLCEEVRQRVGPSVGAHGA